MKHVLIAAALGTALCTGLQTGVSHAEIGRAHV